MPSKKPQRKKPGFMKVGVPGKPVVSSSGATAVQSAPTAGLPSTRQLLKAPEAGRPISNVGKYLIRPTPDDNSGFELVNTDAALVDQVHQKYLKKYELPPALQPKYLRKPEVLDVRRARNISKGFNKPRSRQG